MKLLVEGHPYPFERIKELFPNVDELDVVDGVASVNYVGYYYYATKGTPVFILPKVVIDQHDNVFGVEGLRPEDIIELTESSNKLTQGQRQFIYGLSVWIYRAIAVYRDNCIRLNKDRTIIRQQNAIKIGKGKRRTSNTFLDIILSLIEFNRQNRDWFMFIVKNNRRGFNKINWSQTITKSQVIVQNNEPIYIDPLTKKRQINFDEELLVIFYSNLNHIHEGYGFPIQWNVNYELITGKRFERYLAHKREDGTVDPGFGVRRLRQIKYKYFSDKALQLWELCFAFFDQSRQVKINAQFNEFLLAKNFNIVFEAIIDDLIGDNKFPDKLNKKQEDGKEVDHIFLWDSLTTVEPGKQTFYIGDSKYYKQKNRIGPESVAKQYTYARNVIQWNLNLWFGEDANPDQNESDICLRDELTEGYNVLPNFFISATIPESLDYNETPIEVTKHKPDTRVSQQYKNRLFDRDTLLITHYDVNFLYVVSLYARNNVFKKKQWQIEVRNIFRDKIRKELSHRYDFYAMRAKSGVDSREYIETHFRDILGKVFAPYEDKGIIALALRNLPEFEAENAKLLAQLSESFTVIECDLGTDPRPLLPPPVATINVSFTGIKKRGVIMVMMENYDSRSLKFMELGKVAVPIKYTPDGMDILANATNIGSVLFHKRHQTGQHLFVLRESVRFVPKDRIPEDFFLSTTNIKKPIPDTEIVYLYALLDIDTHNELDSSALDCQRKPFDVKEERYDAQYSNLSDLIVP